MADGKENIPRITRAAAKRAVAATGAGHPHTSSKRKRVPLGELPSVSNAHSGDPIAKKRKDPPADGAPPAADLVTDSDREFDFNDVQLCAHYAPDIYQYLRSMEVEEKRRPAANFLDPEKTDVTPSMRAILVDWLVEVAEEYKLVSDTLYLTVSYVDRFLSMRLVKKQNLQLLGVSSMLIASKYEEITPPHVDDFCYITDNTYTKLEVVKMEGVILNLLNFEMGNPTIKTFLRRFVRLAQLEHEDSGTQLEFLSNYIAELSLLHYGPVRFLPSLVAASSVFLAKVTINPTENPWDKMLRRYSGYRPSQLKDCVLVLHDLQLKKKCPNLGAIRNKYKHHKYKFVGTLIPPSEIPLSYFEDS